MTESQIRQNFVDTAISYLNIREGTAAHQALVDLYNSHTPRARGYALKTTDAWCAGFVSAVAIKCGLTDIVPTEVGCGQMIALFQKLGRWQENDTYAPAPGDIIFYDWQDTGKGDNKNSPDHVGIVVSVSGNTIRVIEGNKSDKVDYRDIAVNGKYIRGYGVPDFASKATKDEKTVEEIAKEVIAGKWGVGADRKAKLTAAGYDYAAVQAKVNELLSGKSVDAIAKEVIAGKWGDGAERKKKLTAAGFDYNAVQKRVNELLSGK